MLPQSSRFSFYVSYKYDFKSHNNSCIYCKLFLTFEGPVVIHFGVNRHSELLISLIYLTNINKKYHDRYTWHDHGVMCISKH